MATVLIAGRHPATIARIEAALVREGIDVLTTSTGLGAVRLAALREVRIVLLDLGLPDVDDTPIFERVLSCGVDLRVVALGENDDASAAVSYLNRGAVDYISRPVSVTEITARIRAQLRCVALAVEAA